MLLNIYRDKELINSFEDCESSFMANLFVVANGTNKTKMKVVNHMDGTATIKFYLDKGVIYEYIKVPYHCGYLDESAIYNGIYGHIES